MGESRMTMTKAVFVDGVLQHFGEWEERKEKDENGNDVILNPFPEGGVYVDVETCIDADGGLRLASDYKELRRVEYPPIREQLDALYHAGAFSEEMMETLRAVKEKYPKPEDAS
jgi:hypothetical protein